MVWAPPIESDTWTKCQGEPLPLNTSTATETHYQGKFVNLTCYLHERVTCFETYHRAWWQTVPSMHTSVSHAMLGAHACVSSQHKDLFFPETKVIWLFYLLHWQGDQESIKGWFLSLQERTLWKGKDKPQPLYQVEMGHMEPVFSFPSPIRTELWPHLWIHMKLFLQKVWFSLP